MENIFEYMKSIFAAVMSFFVMLSGMLGINTGKPESDIPETASGTITAEALGIEDDAEPETAVLEHELLKASPSSITESGTFSVGVADIRLSVTLMRKLTRYASGREYSRPPPRRALKLFTTTAIFSVLSKKKTTKMSTIIKDCP